MTNEQLQQGNKFVEAMEINNRKLEYLEKLHKEYLEGKPVNIQLNIIQSGMIKHSAKRDILRAIIHCIESANEEFQKEFQAL